MCIFEHMDFLTLQHTQCRIFKLHFGWSVLGRQHSCLLLGQEGERLQRPLLGEQARQDPQDSWQTEAVPEGVLKIQKAISIKWKLYIKSLGSSCWFSATVGHFWTGRWVIRLAQTMTNSIFVTSNSSKTSLVSLLFVRSGWKHVAFNGFPASSSLNSKRNKITHEVSGPCFEIFEN